jgi:phosphoribosyl-AMP cyclohydrolase
LLPAKKKKEKRKVDIQLDSDEYIGEFTSVLYDGQQAVFMIQSNMYGVTVLQVEKYLTLLRRKVIKETESNDMVELACELSVIIDDCDIQNIKRSQEIRKIRFRAADGIYDALGTDKDNYFSRVRRSLGEKSGYVIDITVSIDKDTEIKSLDEELVNDVADQFDLIKGSQYDPNLLIEITRKETEDSSTELVNLLQPKMTDTISIKVQPRTSVAQEVLAAIMKEEYDKTKKKIYKILGD